jgi:tetratricopeptide (TPR) repeat protein
LFSKKLAHTIYVDILESAPDDETSLGQLIAVWNAAGNVPRAIEYLIRVIIFNQKHFNYRAELGKAFQKNGDYPVAVRCFLAGVQLASESSLAGPAKTAAIYEIQALLGQAMFQMGEPDAGLNFVVVRQFACHYRLLVLIKKRLCT